MVQQMSTMPRPTPAPDYASTRDKVNASMRNSSRMIPSLAPMDFDPDFFGALID